MIRPTLALVAGALFLQGCATLKPVSTPLVGDRPDFTESPDAIERGHVQVESGETVSREADTRTTTVGEVLVRAGIAPRTELRVALNSYVVERTPLARVRGREDGGIGAKVALYDGSEAHRWSPALSLIAATSLPTGSSAVRGTRAEPSAKLIASWSLTERVGFTSNFNYTHVDLGVGSQDEWAGTASLGVSVTERLGSYAEYFAVRARDGAGVSQHFVNAGVTWLVTSEFQLDARLGTGPSRSSGDYFAGIGIVRRW